MIEGCIAKARELHAQAPHLTLGFDGGVRQNHFKQLLEAGVTNLYMASALFRDEDPASLWQTWQALLDTLAVPA